MQTETPVAEPAELSPTEPAVQEKPALPEQAAIKYLLQRVRELAPFREVYEFEEEAVKKILAGTYLP